MRGRPRPPAVGRPGTLSPAASSTLTTPVTDGLPARAVTGHTLPPAVREYAVRNLRFRGVAFDPLFDALADTVASGGGDRLRTLAAQKLNDAAHPPAATPGGVRVVFSPPQREHLRRLLSFEPNPEVAFGLASALAPPRDR